ncbi:MAG: hypothetical protein OSB21_11735, partial [Myxococcota bacterium]|nr:hypothetical protein [Myxococcota bacterium]
MPRLSVFYVLAISIFFNACAEQVVVRDKVGLCGNQDVETGEQCDDGNSDNGDNCTNGCELARCGDAVTRTDLGPDDEAFESC